MHGVGQKGDWLSRESAEPAVREERGFAPNPVCRGFGIMAWGLSADARAQTDLTREEAVAMPSSSTMGSVGHGPARAWEVGNAWGGWRAAQVGAHGRGGHQRHRQTENPSTFFPRHRVQSVSPGLQVQWTLFDGMAMFANKDRLGLLTEQAEGNVELMVESTVQAVDRLRQRRARGEPQGASGCHGFDPRTAGPAGRSLALGTARTFDGSSSRMPLTDSAACPSTRRQPCGRRNLNLLLAAPDDQAWS